ncbi:prosaposin-like [Impatiens glandulifera]|uniref:prosaposin-like n=1 Tax=Impatiens glandulifera TaxID=253017 RepID=UPI001FB14009|nr:prosaposin-like [Impatiens glandulifera]
MDSSPFLVLLFLLLSFFCVSNARELKTTHSTSVYDDSGLEINRKPNLCSLCEEYTAEAVLYISQNKTQTQIIETLHKSCSRMLTFEKQCITLVNYYAPIFFLELQTTQPKTLCQKFNLCQEEKQVMVVYQHLREDKCEICQHVISEARTKLKDPDTQLEIIEVLLKACNSIKGQVKKCKTMVLEYLPLILVNAEHLLESTDICKTMHVCPSSSSIIIRQAAPLMEDKTSVVSVL